MLRVWDAVLPSADVAVTVIAQRPAVRSRGGKLNDPSVSTSTVVPGASVAAGDAAGLGLPAGVGAGVGAAASLPLPRNVAVTVTVLAFVVVPSTAMAPLPYVVPSTGWEMS